MISFQLFCESDYHHAFVMAPSSKLGLNNTLDLPPKQPYGFWVNKWGHWVAVPPYGHFDAAGDIIDAYQAISGIDIGSGGVYQTLWRHGFIRIVTISDFIYWTHPSRNFVPTQSQQKFLKQLEIAYNVPVIRDESNVGH